jgi:hypothetical protein
MNDSVRAAGFNEGEANVIASAGVTVRVRCTNATGTQHQPRASQSGGYLIAHRAAAKNSVQRRPRQAGAHCRADQDDEN